MAIKEFLDRFLDMIYKTYNREPLGEAKRANRINSDLQSRLKTIEREKQELSEKLAEAEKERNDVKHTLSIRNSDLKKSEDIVTELSTELEDAKGKVEAYTSDAFAAKHGKKRQAVMFISEDGKIKHANSAAIELFGENIIGKPGYAVIPYQAYTGLRSLYANKENPLIPEQMQFRTVNGTESRRIELAIDRELYHGFEINIQKQAKPIKTHYIRFKRRVTEDYLQKPHIVTALANFLTSQADTIVFDLRKTRYMRKEAIRKLALYEFGFLKAKSTTNLASITERDLQHAKSFVFINASDKIKDKIIKLDVGFTEDYF